MSWLYCDPIGLPEVCMEQPRASTHLGLKVYDVLRKMSCRFDEERLPMTGLREAKESA
jgi:hypothetical protein